MLEHPHSMPGLGDGGAQVGTVCDASFPSFFLAYWCRDRDGKKIPLERTVNMLSNVGADYLGLTDRRTLTTGKRADINGIDHAHLELGMPRMVRDLPAGGRRLLQGVAGFRATLVNGQIAARDGALTGVLAGGLLRSKA